MACNELQKDPNESMYMKTEELIRDGKWPSAMNNLIRRNYTGVTLRLNRRLNDLKLNLPMTPILARYIGLVYFKEKARKSL